MRFILVFYLTLLTTFVFSQEKREHFRGGMFPHIGFIKNKTDDTKIDGFCSGIGGKLVFPVSKHIRIGTEGYVTSYNYKQNDGFYKLGWGGLLVEYQVKMKRLVPVIGCSFGGAGVKDLFPMAGDYTDNIPDVAIYKNYSTFFMAPQISLEYSLTSHINLATKVDYLVYPGNEYPNYIAKGVKIYFGILFSR